MSSSFTILHITGKDIIDLLHRITTYDFHLNPSDFQPALILNPQGKIVASFEWRKTNPEQIEIKIPFAGTPDAKQSFLDVLDHFTFSEKYTVTESILEETIDEEQELARIKNEIPILGKEFQCDGKTSPLDINLNQAISDQKGCYPGQEVIEKVIAIGQAPKRLKYFQTLDLSIKENDKLFYVSENNSVQEVGIITSTFQDNSNTPAILHGLAIIRKTVAAPGTELFTENFTDSKNNNSIKVKIQ